jgi:hypothetical protein
MKVGDRVNVVGDGEIIPFNPPNAFIRQMKGPNQFLVTDTANGEYTWGAWMERDEIAPIKEPFWKRRFRLGSENNFIEMPVVVWMFLLITAVTLWLIK